MAVPFEESGAVKADFIVAKGPRGVGESALAQKLRRRRVEEKSKRTHQHEGCLWTSGCSERWWLGGRSEQELEITAVWGFIQTLILWREW